MVVTPDVKRFSQAMKHLFPSFRSYFHPSVQNWSTLQLIYHLALLPSTATIVLMSTFATRRLLGRLGVKSMLLLGLSAMGLGQLAFSFVTAGGSYLVNVLPGVLLSALGLSVAL